MGALLGTAAKDFSDLNITSNIQVVNEKLLTLQAQVADGAEIRASLPSE